MKHRRRKQREHAGQQAPHRRRDGHRARGVQLERIDQVVQRRLEDGQRAGPGRLAEEEEACGKEERAGRHRREPRFGDGGASCCRCTCGCRRGVEDVEEGAESAT
jgi:hypothetical protein